MRVLHIPCFSLSEPLPVLLGHLSALDSFKSIGLVTTAQHLNKLDDMAVLLRKNGKKVFVGGQILGCNQKKALEIQDKVDCFLYIGSGRFHPLGVAMKTSKPVFLLNPVSRVFDRIEEHEKNPWTKNRRQE